MEILTRNIWEMGGKVIISCRLEYLYFVRRKAGGRTEKKAKIEKVFDREAERSSIADYPDMILLLILNSPLMRRLS